MLGGDDTTENESQFNRGTFIRHRQFQEEQQVQISIFSHLMFYTDIEELFPDYSLHLQYGLLDEANNLVPKLEAEMMRHYQETLELTLHEVSECSHDSGIKRGILMESVENKLKVFDKFEARLKEGRIKQFDINPFTNHNSTEYFLLPRRYFTFDDFVYDDNTSSSLQLSGPSQDLPCSPLPTTSQEHLQNDSEQLPTGIAEESGTLDNAADNPDTKYRTFDGLGCFDPILQDHTRFVERIPEHIGPVLASRFSQLLTNYPYGITITRLNEIIAKGWGIHRARDFCCGIYPELIYLLRHLPDICWIQEACDSVSRLPPPLSSLLFHESLNGFVCSTEKWLTRLWHNYVTMVATFDDPIPLQGSWKLLCKFLGMEDMESCIFYWGFETTESFVKYCLKYFGNGNVGKPGTVHIVLASGEDEEQSKLFVYHGQLENLADTFISNSEDGTEKDYGATHFRSITDNNTNMTAAILPGSSEILPSTRDFSREPLTRVTDLIEVGDNVICVRGLMRRPYCLSLIRADDKIVLKSLRKYMTNYYNHARSRNIDNTQLDLDIAPGTLVAAHFRQYWFRATIIKKNPGVPCSYKVYFVDMAAFATVLHSNLASIRGDFCGVAAVGILCHLELGNLGVVDNNQNTRDRISQKRRLLKLRNIILRGNIWSVSFIKCDRVMDQPFWTVKIDASHWWTQTDGKADTKYDKRFYASGINRRLLKPIARVRSARKRGSKTQGEIVSNGVVKQNGGTGRRMRRNVYKLIKPQHLHRTLAMLG